MAPDQLLATIAALLSGPSAHFDDLRMGGFSPQNPVAISACDADLGPFEIEGTTLICGSVNLPENYDAPADRRIDLKFAVLRTQTLSPSPDPLVYLHGGPAAGTLDLLEPVAAVLFPNHRRTRDIITFDQRAAALSARSVQCSENIAAHIVELAAVMSKTDITRTFQIADQQATIYENIFGSVFNVDIYACQEDIPWNSPAGFDAVQADIAQTYPFLDDPDIRAYMDGFFKQCTMFEQHPRAEFQTPVFSDVPVLTLNGALDIQTSMHWGALASKTLSHARTFIIPEAGHGTIAYQPCANDISVAFVNAPNADLDTSCITDLKPVFDVPEQ